MNDRIVICPTCRQTTRFGTTTSPATGDDHFCSERCLEQDPRYVAMARDAVESFGLFTCHGANGEPYGGRHWCGR